MNRAIASAGAVVSTALALTVVAAPAQAKFAPPLGDWGSAAQPPGTIYNNGLAQLDVGVTSASGSMKPGAFAPRVTWSGHTAKGKPVTGRKCRIEITFPGHRWPMYKSRNCQGAAAFPKRVYTVPGRYSITVQERVSGRYTTVPFIVAD